MSYVFMPSFVDKFVDNADATFYDNVAAIDPSTICFSTVPSTISSNKCVVFPTIEKVIFNDPATIVWFGDGTKVVVKKSDADEYSKEHALLYAIAKRLYGCVNSDGNVSSNGFMSFLKKTVERGIDQLEVARKAAEQKKAKKTKSVESKLDKASTTSTSSKNTSVKRANVSAKKYFSKKANKKA